MRFPLLSDKRAFGRTQEANAVRYLRAQGLTLLCSNFHSRYGEIDLVMADGDTLVFVEVRFRRSELYGGALATVTQPKQRKIRLTAAHYLQSRPQYEACPCRFDVIGIGLGTASDKPSIDWIKNAFQ